MKKFYCLFVLLATMSAAFAADSYLPILKEGRNWRYIFRAGAGVMTGYDTYLAKGTKEIDGKVYTKIFLFGQVESSSELIITDENAYYHLVREEDGKIYYRTNDIYPGIPELLETLQHKGYKLAVASNKYQAATEKLIAHYFPGIRFVAVFGQREGVKVKPDPAVVHDILQIAGVSKDEVLYVGDSGVDMQTAINSGVTSCGVTWGFRPRTELESFCPDYIVDKAETILSIV